MPGDRLMLLDSASLYFRAFFGVPGSVTAPDGRPVNAVRGFLDMVATLVSTYRPTRLVAAWDDDWRPAFRVAAVPSYKAHRLADPASGTEETPPDLAHQVDAIVDVLEALGVARVGVPGFEADDVVAALAAREDGATPVDVVSGDRDLLQLVDDAAGVRVLYTGKGVRNLQVVDEAALRARYGVATGAQYADMAVLRGDPSDGLPGVAGIGEKTAVGLITRFGSLEALLEAAAADEADLSPGQRRALREHRDYAERAAVVVRAQRDLDLPQLDDALARVPADVERLAALADRWGVRSSVNRLLAAVGLVDPAAAPPKAPPEAPPEGSAPVAPLPS